MFLGFRLCRNEPPPTSQKAGGAARRFPLSPAQGWQSWGVRGSPRNVGWGCVCAVGPSEAPTRMWGCKPPALLTPTWLWMLPLPGSPLMLSPQSQNQLPPTAQAQLRAWLGLSCPHSPLTRTQDEDLSLALVKSRRDGQGSVPMLPVMETGSTVPKQAAPCHANPAQHRPLGKTANPTPLGAPQPFPGQGNDLFPLHPSC